MADEKLNTGPVSYTHLDVYKRQGQYRINLLEPRCWDDGSGPEDPDAPDAFPVSYTHLDVYKRQRWTCQNNRPTYPTQCASAG